MATEGVPLEAVELVHKVEPLIRALPPDQQQEIREVITMAVSFQGPLPHPALLEQYGRIVPDAPERIIALLEKQTEHRIAMESALVNGRVSLSKVGQRMAFALSLFFGSIAAALGYYGHDWLAGTIATTTIVGLAVVFVLGKEPGKPDKPSAPLEPANKADARATATRKRRGG